MDGVTTHSTRSFTDSIHDDMTIHASRDHGCPVCVCLDHMFLEDTPKERITRVKFPVVRDRYVGILTYRKSTKLNKLFLACQTNITHK